MRFHFKYTYEEFFFTTAWITGTFETEAFEAVIGSVPVTPFGADTLKVVVPADLPVTVTSTHPFPLAVIFADAIWSLSTLQVNDSAAS